MTTDSPAVWAAKKSGTEGGKDMGKHTPGPFHVGVGIGSFPIQDEWDKTIAKAWRREDAVLFAAAPDLLEAAAEALDALRVAVRFGTSDDDGNPLPGFDVEEHVTIKRLRAAITKATGGAP